jgi:hypothetical protein
LLPLLSGLLRNSARTQLWAEKHLVDTEQGALAVAYALICLDYLHQIFIGLVDPADAIGECCTLTYSTPAGYARGLHKWRQHQTQSRTADHAGVSIVRHGQQNGLTDLEEWVYQLRTYYLARNAGSREHWTGTHLTILCQLNKVAARCR